MVPALMMAQVIRGRVVDRTQGAPIPSATVSLADTAGALMASVLTDADGAFEVRARGAGRYWLRFRRIGYQRRDLELDLGTNASVQVPEDQSSVEALPVVLEEATVAADRHRRLESAGFYQRREEGHGSFITREEFEVMQPSRTTDVLRRLRGIRLRPNPGYGAGDNRRYIVETSRGGGAMTFRGRCPTMYFVDGIHVGTSEDRLMDIDALILVHEVEAIEVYSGSGQIPAKYNMMGGLCGVILLWTQ